MPYSPRTRRFFQTFAKGHGWLLIRTKGRPARLGIRRAQYSLVLETIGRRSGRTRAVPLLYLPDGDRFIVIASNYGQERPPAWWFNLQTEPDAHVLHKGRRIAVRARELAGDERAALVPRCRDYNPQWRTYLVEVERHLPIVALEHR